MTRFWEKVFFVFSYITQGSSYMSPRAYGIMHRMHHAFTDTEHDPHSPSYDENILRMMWRTRNVYAGILNNRVPIEERFTKNVPEWKWFDKWGNNFISRFIWIAIYVAIYLAFAPSLWWLLLVPVHVLMGPIHGIIINWFAHKYGNTNFETDNTSKNLFKVDLLMLGEGYHNNHHVRPASSNFAAVKGEFDLCYPAIKLLHKLKVIRMVGT
jgi:stearoyl-CoA desaturase (delta-9 desaturase)